MRLHGALDNKQPALVVSEIMPHALVKQEGAEEHSAMSFCSVATPPGLCMPQKG